MLLTNCSFLCCRFSAFSAFSLFTSSYFAFRCFSLSSFSSSVSSLPFFPGFRRALASSSSASFLAFRASFFFACRSFFAWDSLIFSILNFFFSSFLACNRSRRNFSFSCGSIGFRPRFLGPFSGSGSSTSPRASLSAFSLARLSISALDGRPRFLG